MEGKVENEPEEYSWNDFGLRKKMMQVSIELRFNLSKALFFTHKEAGVSHKRIVREPKTIFWKNYSLT